jgi:hypothetical protein
MSAVLPFCFSTPLTRSFTALRCGSPNSSAVTTTGPIGQNVSRLFPLKNCMCAFWRSRAVTSLTTV